MTQDYQQSATVWRLAPFGWFTRHMLQRYSRTIAVVLGALLSISLTTDVPSWIAALMRDHPELSVAGLAIEIGLIVARRAADLMPLTLPISCFLGVLWAEINQASSRERMAVWNAGRSPIQCIVPVLIVAVVTGGAQFLFEAWLRPAAVMALENRPSPERPDDRPSRDLKWIAVGSDLIRARIVPGPPTTLRDVVIYNVTTAGAIPRVTFASAARSGDGPGEWTLEQGRLWTSSAEGGAQGGAEGGDLGTERPFDRLTVALNLDPLWLYRFGVHPQYLPHSELRSLTFAAAPSYDPASYRTWYALRYAHILLPGAMALLAFGMAMWALPYRARIPAIIVVAFAGYLSHVAGKVFAILGEHGIVPATAAAFAVPVATVLAGLAFSMAAQVSAGGRKGIR